MYIYTLTQVSWLGYGAEEAVRVGSEGWGGISKEREVEEEETREGWMTNGKWLCSYRFFILDKQAEFRKQACRAWRPWIAENTGHVPVECQNLQDEWHVSTRWPFGRDAPWEDTAQLCNSTGNTEALVRGFRFQSPLLQHDWVCCALKTLIFDLCCPDSFNTWALS